MIFNVYVVFRCNFSMQIGKPQMGLQLCSTRDVNGTVKAFLQIGLMSDWFNVGLSLMGLKVLFL